MRRIAAGLLALGALVVRMALPSPATPAPDVRADAEWLLSVQTSEGIITQGIDRVWCVPYFANIGARGLAGAYAATGDARYANAAWRWLSWYQAHMNPNGFVTDYRLQNGRWTSTGTMDSTDAYAATFLSALGDLYYRTGDLTRLNGLRTGVQRAAAAIEATTDSDGLTWAKPDYRMKYLMDNAEVYEGWLAAVRLAAALGDTSLRNRAQARADSLAQRFASYRNPSLAGFDWAIGETGIHERLDWRQFYPSATAQAWPVVAGLAAQEDADAAMGRLDAEQPGWDRPDWRSIIVDREAPIGYWPSIARGFLRAGLTERARAAYENIEAYAAGANRYWPFHPGTAGELILFANEIAPPPPPPPPPTPSPSPSPQPQPPCTGALACAAQHLISCVRPEGCD